MDESNLVWKRENGEEVNIRDMNNFHLLAAIKKIEKTHVTIGLYNPPKIYFNMVALAYSRGLGITDIQIRAFIAQVVP
jgi:hypothetical protein